MRIKGEYHRGEGEGGGAHLAQKLLERHLPLRHGQDLRDGLLRPDEIRVVQVAEGEVDEREVEGEARQDGGPVARLERLGLEVGEKRVVGDVRLDLVVNVRVDVVLADAGGEGAQIFEESLKGLADLAGDDGGEQLRERRVSKLEELQRYRVTRKRR